MATGKGHKLSGSKQEELIVSQSWRPEVRKTNWFLLEGPEGGSVLCTSFSFRWLLTIHGISWLVQHFNLCLIFIGPSLLPDVCLTFHGFLLLVSLFSHLLSCQLYQTRTYPNSIRYHLNFIICKDHISKLYHIPRYWGLGLQVSLGRHNFYYNNCN